MRLIHDSRSSRLAGALAPRQRALLAGLHPHTAIGINPIDVANSLREPMPSSRRNGVWGWLGEVSPRAVGP
jgi:hypothetical protein